MTLKRLHPFSFCLLSNSDRVREEKNITHTTHILVKHQTHSLDRNVPLLPIYVVFQLGTQDTGGNEAASTDSDKQCRSYMILMLAMVKKTNREFEACSEVIQRRTKLLLDLNGGVLDSLVDIIVAQSEPGEMSICIVFQSVCRCSILT